MKQTTNPFKNDKQAVINMWKTEGTGDYGYFDSVEEQLGLFWKPGSMFTKLFDRLDLESVVEIACGKGRHGARIRSLRPY